MRTHKLSFDNLENRIVPATAVGLTPEPLRVVLVSEAVAHADRVVASADPGVIALRLNTRADTNGLADSLQALSAAHGGAAIGRLGLVAHGRAGRVGSFWSAESLARDAGAWARLRAVLADDARIDLYACHVAADGAGRTFVDGLADATGAAVRASTDAAGSGARGDWAWEYAAGADTADSPLLDEAALEAIPGLLLDDAYEPNDGKTEVDGSPRPAGSDGAPHLGRLTAQWTVTGLALEDGADWFRFETAGVGTTASAVRIDFRNADGRLRLEVFRSNGRDRVGFDDNCCGADYRQVSLAGERSGTFYVKVVPSRAGGANPSYSLSITPPAEKPDDAYEPNDSKSDVDARPPGAPNSPNLGLLRETQTVTGLVLDDDADWFRFQIGAAATNDHLVRIDLRNDDGRLRLEVLRSNGQDRVGFDNNCCGADYRQVRLAGQAPGVYYVKVTGSPEVKGNAAYQLQIVPPPVQYTVVPDSPRPGNLGQAGILFAKTREAYTNIVIRAYERFLGRQPDPAGLEGWVQKMLGGLTEEQLEAGFISSAEFIQRSGGRGRGWIVAMYENLLGRTPAEDEIQGWLRELERGVPEYHIAYGFTASDERERQRIRRNYLTFLEREPSESEIISWLKYFQRGGTNQDIIAGFVASPEYYDKPSMGNGNRAVWVTLAYSDVLERWPTPEEVDTWLGFLR